MTHPSSGANAPFTFFALSILGALAGSALAQGQPTVPFDASAPKWGAYLDLEAKPGNKRSLGEVDLFVPLAQDGRSLFFGNLRGRFADGSSREGNFGLGVRRMLDNGWNIGAYGYLDRRRTPQGSSFGQATLGVEALGRDWDLRANTYTPYGSRVNNLGADPVTATLSGTSIQVTTPGMRQERALGGYDAEAGWRLPMFRADDAQQLRVYLGGYRFSDSVSRVAGTRLRAEYTVAELPQLWKGAQMILGAEVQNDAARGSQRFVSLRLRVPFGGGSQTGARRLTTQEQRMTAPIVRDVDIVSQVVTGAPVVETASALAGGQNFTLLSSDSTTGAALPGAVAAAGANSTVVLAGSFNTSAITQLQPGQTLMGAGPLSVRTPSGRIATFNAPGATITGAVAGNNGAVHMANNSTLAGMTVSNLSTGGGTPNPYAVKVDGVSNARIINNDLSVVTNFGVGSAQAIQISNNASNILVSGNRLTATGSNTAIGVNVVDSSATVTNNILSATGGTALESRATSVNNANILPGSTGNTIVKGMCHVLGAGTGSQISFTNAASCGP